MYFLFNQLDFFFKQKTAYEMLRSLVGSEMCIRDSCDAACVRKSSCCTCHLVFILSVTGSSQKQIRVHPSVHDMCAV